MKKYLVFLLFFGTSLSYSAPIKKALVTGGAGFLGSHMCDYLLHQGYEIVCVDNLLTGSLSNIAHLKNHPDFTFLNHDIINPLPQDLFVDEIYNFACPASPPLYQKDPIHTLKTNIYGSLNLLELAQKCHATIFQSSTSEVYGDPLVHPQKETYWGNVNPHGIRSCYDEGKRAAETLFFDFHRQYRTKIKVGRIFNTYGPRMSQEDGRVVSNFIVQALLNLPITVYGKGCQTRSFCFVSDLIEAIYSFMHTTDEITGPINLGNPYEYTVEELASFITQQTRSHSSLIFKPLPQDDPQKRKPDISLAKQLLNWEPRVSLEKGLEETIKYFKNQIELTAQL